MLNISGVEIQWDITAPGDVLRYKQAGERMEEVGRAVALPSVPEGDPGYLDAYIGMLNAELTLYGNFLDEVFGDGIAEKLLGKNPSLNKITEVSEAMEAAMAQQGKDFGVRLQKFEPNRATRRKKK